jgi:hypothetical protein
MRNGSINALKQVFSNEKIDEKSEIEHIKLTTESLCAARNMQIIYIVDMLEIFMKDYISLRDQVEVVDWKEYLKEFQSKYERYVNINNLKVSKSNSLMNINFSRFILEEKYFIQFPESSTSVISELGSLRNCLVHHDGDVNFKDKGNFFYYDTLDKTIKELKFLDINTGKILLNDEFVMKVIKEIQDFLAICGK